MRTWVYKGTNYTTKRIDWKNPDYTNAIRNDDNMVLVYNASWDKCYWLSQLTESGNTSKVCAFLFDIYKEKHCYFTNTKHLYLVIKKNEINK